MQACGSVLSQAPHSNLVTSLSLASVNSVNSLNQNIFLQNNQLQKSRLVNGSQLLGQQFPSYHAIINGSNTSTKKSNLGKTAVGLGQNVSSIQFLKGSGSRNSQNTNNQPGLQSVDEIENQKLQQQQKSDNLVSSRLTALYQNNENQFQQNTIFNSNRSSQSIQKSPINGNFNPTNPIFQNNLQYLKKRDSSCQDGAAKQFQPLQEIFNNSRQKLTTQDTDKNNKFIKLSPQKTQILSLGAKHSIVEESHQSYMNQLNIIKANNSASSINQSTSQQIGRNKKNESVLSGNLAKGQNLYIHQSSMNKLEQIKNIYSLQDKLPAKQSHQLSSEYAIQHQSALDSINIGYDDFQNQYKISQRNNKVITSTANKNSVYQNNKNQIKVGVLSLSRNSNASSNNQKNQTPGSIKNDFFKGVLLTQSIVHNPQNTKQDKTISSPINEQISSFKNSNIQKTDFNSSKSFQNHHQKFIILNKQSISQKQKKKIKDKASGHQQSIQEQMKQSDQMKKQTIQNQSDNQSKINSYYNTKSSFGIRQSSCNYPLNSNLTKKQDFQQIKVKGKLKGGAFGNQTHKALKNPHLNTQTELKNVNAEKANNIVSLRQGKNASDILSNEDLQIKSQNSRNIDDQQKKVDELKTQKNEEDFNNIEKRIEKTEQKEDLSNSFQINLSENKTNTINNTLQKKLGKPVQKIKKQDQNMIPKDQKLQSEKLNHQHQNLIIKQKLFDLEMTNPIRLTGDFKNNQEMDNFLKKQINKLPSSEVLASMSRDNLSISAINEKNKDTNSRQGQNINEIPFRNDYYLAKDNIQKSQVSKTKSKIEDLQDEMKQYKIDIMQNENLDNEVFNNIKAFKTPFVANKKSMNQIDNNKVYENSIKLKSESNHNRLPDIFKNNFQMQSKSEQKLVTVNLNNNLIENSQKKHQKSHDLLAIDVQNNEVASAVKSNLQLYKELRQNNLSRGENLNFEFQKFNRLQDIKSENGINLSPSRQLSSDKTQIKTKLKYNELLKMNADIKKKNIQFLNDKLGKINRAILQGESNSVCFQNDPSNDTNNSINFKMINDEEEINQIQNNSYDSLLPNKNINGSFETSSNKKLPQSVSLNIYSQKILNLQNNNKTKRNIPAKVEDQSYSSLEQQNSKIEYKYTHEESNQKNNVLAQNNSTASLNYKDQQNQEIMTDIHNNKQKFLNNDSRQVPGTANTHGGYMRQNYKQKQQQVNLKENLNFKDSSLQCQSEAMNMINFDQNSSALNQNFQQISYLDQMPVYNINSDFDRSFEILDPMNFHNSEFHYPNQQLKSNLYRQNQDMSHQMSQNENNMINFIHYQNKGAIGEGVVTDDMSSIPSIHSIPVIRNQKSQATYRHGHQKISEVLNKYYHNNYGNSYLQQINNSGLSDTSKSEVYKNYMKIQQSQASAPLLAGQYNHDIYSQINDHQINTTQISQLSHNSEMGGMMELQNFTRHPGTKQEVYRNKKKNYEGKDGAFSGDDRHPFNGPKLHLFRKGQSKSSQAKLRKIKRSQQNVQSNEINSLAGLSQIKLNQVKQNESKYQQDIYNDLNIQQQIYDNDMNSVQNSSSIKNQNQLSKNGHINISEILNGKIKLQPPSQYQGQNKLFTDQVSRNSFDSRKSNEIDGDAQLSQEYINYKGSVQNNEDDSSYNHILNDKSLEIGHQNIDFNKQIAYDSDSQNCRSQFTTICQNPQQSSIEQYDNQQIVVGGDVLPLKNINNQRESNNEQSLVQQNQVKDQIQFDINDVERQNSQEIRSVEKDQQNQMNTSQKAQSNQNTSIKPIKSQGSNFQHPKVGKSSKHPQIFRSNINQLNSQKSKKSSAKIDNENGLSLKTQMVNLATNNNFLVELHHSKSHQNLLQELQNNQQSSPGFKQQSNGFQDQNNQKKLSDTTKEEQSSKNQNDVDLNGQISKQLIDQNTIFATTFEGFNQKQKNQNQNNTLKTPPEKYEVQKQGFNVQNNQESKNETSVEQDEKVQIKVRFNENFDYQNSEIDKNQFKKFSTSTKQENKNSLTEQQIQQKRDQIHQNHRNTTFAHQQNDHIHQQIDEEIKINDFTGLNSINSVMSSVIPKDQTIIHSDLKIKQYETQNNQLDVNKIETSSEINGVNLNNTQKSHSIAQTPCFAETPNTTDQFKGYKIDVTD